MDKNISAVMDRFASKWTPEPNSGCHLWLGSMVSGGYGGIKVFGRMVLAHRFSYQASVGEIPPGMHIDHICRNRSCVNPAHLRVVTPRQNVLENSVGITARNAQATHCKRGHALVGTNLRARKDGKRDCVICSNMHRRISRRKKQP